jgi:hypothetical protein
MGADLMISAIEIKHDKETTLRKVDDLVVTETDFANIEEAGVWKYEDQEFSPELVEALREDLRKAVDVIYDSYRRDKALFYVDYGQENQREFVITGGMSWGDAPTDAWDSFELAQLFPQLF